MTDIKEKALALVNTVLNERGMHPYELVNRDSYLQEALCRAIEQHEATKRERGNFAAALQAITEACNDHANTVIQLRAELSDFRQEVSDIVYAHVNATNETMNDAWEKLKTLISPKLKPKPDPLVEVMDELEWCNTELLAREFRAALDARGLEIRSKSND
jgi:hypothetical protein